MATTDKTAPGIRRVNAKSDFDFILKLFCGCAKEGGEPQEIGWPEFDWTARFWTWSPANAYTVSCIGGVCTNCFNDNGRIHAVFDNHRLSPGKLHCELSADIPASIYPDGRRREVLPQPVGIELVSGAGDCGCVGETEVELTLPAVYLTAYDLAVRNGYTGTLDEYVAYVNRFPFVVETSDAVMRLVSDFDTGKAAIADALTRQGAETAPDEPMAAMADKVLGLRLAVEGQPGIVDQSLGGRLPYTDLLNLLRNNRRADLPYCYAVRHALESVMLAGADAYLCSDGFFSEEGGEHVFTDFGDRWVIYYFRNADYLLTAPTPCLEAVALNGRPQFSLAGTEMTSLRSYTEEEYGLEAGLTSMGSALTEITLAGVVRTGVVISTSSTRSLSLPGLQQVGSTLIQGSEVRSLHLPLIKDLGSRLAFVANRLESVSLPALETLRGGNIIDQCHNVKKMDVSKLTEISGGGVAFNSRISFDDVQLPSLTTISGGTVVSSCPALTELTLPALTTISGGTVVFSCPALTELTLPALTTISGGTVVFSCPALTELTLPALTELNAMNGTRTNCIVDNCANLATINLPKLRYSGTDRNRINITRANTANHVVVNMPEAEEIAATMSSQNAEILECRFGAALKAIWLNASGSSSLRVVIPDGVKISIDTSIGGTRWDSDSLRDVIARLGDNSGNETLQLKLGAANLAKLTDEDIALATAKNYTLS